MKLDLSNFFFDTPIYTPITINAENEDFFDKIINYNTRKKVFEGYNPRKKFESTFIISSIGDISYHAIEWGGNFYVKVKCKRSDDIFLYIINWNHEKKRLTKIGQYPSVADFHISEIKQYNNLLSKDKLREFTRAIGLAANGVGIGSFVYLRRIFEYLITEALSSCKVDGKINEEKFNKSRMDEKILLLSDYLPNFLVENRSLYSILSLGIHELDEKECLAYFGTLRVGIEIILDEKLDELRKKEKIKDAKKELIVIKEKLKK